MSEDIHAYITALNIAWQRYARALEQQLDTVPIEALNRDYLAAWERLDDCGIAEWMLVYDPTTMTFSLPEERSTEEIDLNALSLEDSFLSKRHED